MNEFKLIEKAVKSCKSIRESVDSGIVLNLHDRDDRPGSCQTTVVPLFGEEKEVVTFEGYEGTYVVLNALSPSQQLGISKKVMEEWIQPPNTSNIAHQPQDLWKGYVNDMEARELRQSKIGKQSDLSSLRWVTLGRHYDWSNRKYTDYSNPFPAELGQLCKDIVRVVDHENSIEAQAAIINFYPKSSSMGGHQDDAEFCLRHPIVSISLGVACTFLLGGLTKDEKPLAVLLTSGDAVVFGGESRLRYHGVPKVWTGDVDAVPPYFNFVGSTEGRTSADSCHVLIERQEAFWRFMRTTRININVRQVTSGCSLPTAQA